MEDKDASINEQIEQLSKFLSPFFIGEQTRETALKYIKGLISSVERKNSWQLAEETGFSTP